MIGLSHPSSDADLSATLAPGATSATRAAHARVLADDTALAAARTRHDAADTAFDVALDAGVSMSELRRFDDELDHAATATPTTRADGAPNSCWPA